MKNKLILKKSSKSFYKKAVVDILPKECTNSAVRIMPFWTIWAEFTSVSTRENLVMSTIASGKYCALQSSHKKISTSDKVI